MSDEPKPLARPPGAGLPNLRPVLIVLAALALAAAWKLNVSPAREDSPPGVDTEVVLLQPEESAGPTPTFVWHAVAGAAEYRIEVLTEQGVTVVTGVTADTAFTVPAGSELQTGAAYRWQVTAWIPGRGEARAPARPLRVEVP